MFPKPQKGPPQKETLPAEEAGDPGPLGRRQPQVRRGGLEGGL